MKIEPGEIFTDCGACFGDTAVWAYQKGAKQVYCFEPRQSNLETIKANLIDNQFHTTGLIPYAVSDQAKKVEFADLEENYIGCSHIVNKRMNKTMYTEAHANFIEVECVKLDDYCAEHEIKPTFIKMDIEGAEYDALIGAKQIIQKYKPKLAICLYHSLQDMWRIPLLIKQFVPEYRFYCRKNNFCNEFMMYAIC